MSEERGSTLKMQFNKTIIERTKQANIQMDIMGSVMFVLLAIFESKWELLDCADDQNKQRRMIILYRQLERRGFLEKPANSNTLYQLTATGNEFVTYLKEVYEEDVHAESFKEEIATKEDPVVGGWIQQYVDIFPDSKRAHPKTLINKMRAFMKDYNYDKDLILKATRLYIEDQEAAGDEFKYTRTASYFISKDKGEKYVSDLATWCKRVQDEGDAPEQYDTKQFDIM